MSAQQRSRKKSDSKKEKQNAISKAVLEIVELQGLSGITHSKVSRRSQVSRGWIYEYIGKEKDDLAQFAAEVFAQKFAHVGGPMPESHREIRKQLDDGVRYLFDCALSDPVIIRLYFRLRGTTNPIGKIIERYENQWLDSAAKKLVDFVKLPKEQSLRIASLLVALRLGACHRMVSAKDPNTARKHLEGTFNEIHSLIEYFEQLGLLNRPQSNPK